MHRGGGPWDIKTYIPFSGKYITLIHIYIFTEVRKIMDCSPVLPIPGARLSMWYVFDPNLLWFRYIVYDDFYFCVIYHLNFYCTYFFIRIFITQVCYFVDIYHSA